MRKLFMILTLASASWGAPQLLLTPVETTPEPLSSTLYFNTSAVIAEAENVGLHTHQELLSCQPSIKASFSYNSATQIALYPHDPLEAGKRYRCQINSKLLPFSSKEFSFTTKALISEAERFGKMVRLSFNAPVDSAKLEKALTVVRSNRLSTTALPFELSGDPQRVHFTLFIKEDISNDKLRLTLSRSLDPSLKSDQSHELSYKEEPKVLFDKERKTMLFTTPPRFLAKEDGSLAIRLYLPHYFYDASSIKSFIEIEGVESFSISSPEYLYGDEREKYQIPADHYYYVDISSDAFQSQKRYTLTVKKGIKDAYSFQSQTDKSFSVVMGDRAPAVMFEGDKPYLSSLGEVGLKSVNMPYVTVVIEKLLDQNYRYFTNFSEGSEAQVENLAKEIASKKFILDGKKNSFSRQKISLRPFMKKFSNGVYRIVLHYKDTVVSKAVYYSDIGLSAKVSNDQLFVWATQLSSAKPLAGVTINAYSAKNELLGTLSTDANGVALLEQKDIAKANVHMITAQRGNEYNFLTLSNVLNSVTLPYESDIKDRFKAMIYLQSKLVRPGNDARILFVLKDKNYIAANKLPIKIRVVDPGGRTVYDQAKTTSTHGAVDLTLPIPDEYKTGSYTITAKFGKHLIGSSAFSVENFMPQRIKNMIGFDKEAISSGELLGAHLSSAYLFGAPASSLKATAKLTAVSKIYTNELYKEYHFSNDQLAKNNSINYLQITKAFQLNKNGKSDLFFPTKITQNPPSILEAQVELTVLDDGRAVSAYKSAVLYPYKTMVGVALEKPSIEKGESLHAKTLRIDPVSGKKVAGLVEAVLKKSLWNYSYDSNGYYKWYQKLNVVDRKVLRSGDPYEKEIDESGDYILELHDHLSGHSATQSFAVRGWDYSPIDPTNDMGKVQVKVTDKGYKKGEILHLDLKSPITKGSLLVTLEDAKIRWSKVVAVDNGSASLDIPLRFDFEEGLYLRTAIVRATDTPSTLVPFRAQSVTFIKPDKEAFRQAVAIQAPKTSGSKRPQTIEVTARPNSSVVVSVVDEGILQIKGQQAPKAFEFFQNIPKERVAFYDLFDKVMHHITKGKMLSFGGDDGAQFRAKRKHMAPQTSAKRVKPFVYWSGVVQAGADGKAKVTLDIPDFNGEANIVAVAFDAQSIGVASDSLVVKDDIIIKATYPRFLHIGDTVEVPVRLFNTTQEKKSLRLQVKNSQETELTLEKQSVEIPANSSLLVTGHLKGVVFGGAKITLLGSGGGKTFTSDVEIPVYSPFALETQVYRGETKKREKIDIGEQYFSATPTQLTLTLSNSYLAQLKGSLNTLLGYPHGCAEQTSSKLLAMLYLEKFIQGKTDEHTQALLQDRKRFIQEGIDKLAAMQKQSGEFGYWSLDSFINPYASIYTSDLFLELKAQGYRVENQTIARIYSALKSQANGLGLYLYGKTSSFERLYAAYLLSNAKQLDQSVANAIYDQKLYQSNLVGHYMMAAILQNNHLTAQRDKVLNEIENYDLKKLTDEIDLGGSFYAKSRDLAFALYLHAKHFQKNALSLRLLEAVAGELEHAYSTQSHAFIMRAMQEYYKDEKPTAMAADITFNGTKTHYDKPVTLQSELTQKTVTIEPKKGLVNYAIEVANYVEKPLSHQPLAGQQTRVKLVRNYVNEEGVKIDPSTLHVGDLFYSEISMQSNEELKNLVVSDRIASCFDIVNERLTSHRRSNKIQNSKNFKADHQDIMDDKVITFLSLPSGVRTYNSMTRKYEYLPNTLTFFQPLRITSKGSCHLPAVVAEAMYDARITAYDKEYKEITISSDPASQAAPASLLKQSW